MKKKRPPPPPKPPRNPHAKVLGRGPFKPRVEKDPDAYVRRPRHRKRPGQSGDEGDQE
jgi:hypothetical protein